MQEAAVDKPDRAVAKKTPSRRPIIFGVLGVLLASGALYYRHTLSFVETDDAQIDGDITAISPRVTGTVLRVLVTENQRVKAGDVLAEIDPVDYEIAHAQAKANVALAEAQLRAEQPTVAITETSNEVLLKTSSADVSSASADLASAEATLRQAEAQLAQAESNEKQANTDYDRVKALVTSGSLANAELDQKTTARDVAHSAVLAAQQAKAAAAERVNQARARLSASSSRVAEVQANSPRQVTARQASLEVRQANLDLAKAQLHQAELNLEHTKIVAPVAGVIGKKSVSVGDRVQPGQQLMALTQLERIWVTANFRETQLKSIRPGLPVDIHVDALDVDLHGTVEAIGGATGSRYSLLPPENATGNYVKVVQRVPVRIALDPNQNTEGLLPGLSVEPSVKVK